MEQSTHSYGFQSFAYTDADGERILHGLTEYEPIPDVSSWKPPYTTPKIFFCHLVLQERKLMRRSCNCQVLW
ncbi:hypothetical protein GDO81_018420 [Engystomops pustulosus]|uniref:Uncharacterized protein n=1 Tax=Engystomops pustulosus TaxID=76066 RepID=A0AAV7AF97_ENGPU|nr:hypothetical protein GDO81_026656 [Engystomops pustulosus]KAG8557348.1 hypothetical protein GDO81_018420 [Engystomops pustulosus]